MTTRGADIEAALVYTCVWPVVAIVACVASFSVLALANALELPYAPYAIVMTLNVAPAFVCGLVVYRILSRRNGLPPREREIIILIAQGYKNKEIAEKMFITEQTVKNHLHNVFDKLGVSDRLELALYAIHNSLHLRA